MNSKYLINRPQRSDRFNQWHQVFANVVGSFGIIKPIENIETLIEFRKRKIKAFATTTKQISCYLSHKEPTNSIFKKPYIIFEDDAYTDSQIFNLANIETELETIDCDLALVGTWFTPHAKVSHLQGYWYTVHNGVIGGHTYFVKNANAFQKIFETNQTANFDDVLHEAIAALKVVCLVPAFTYQKASESDISPGAPISHTEQWTKRFYATTLAEWEGSPQKKEFEQRHLIPKF